MTKVISFISSKEGSGKTTNAIHLCTSLFASKKKVILIETDPEYKLISDRKMEIFKFGLNETDLFTIKASNSKVAHKEIHILKDSEDYDFIIIDSAKNTTNTDIKELCIASDLILVTTNLVKNNLLATYKTVKDLKPAQKINPNLKISILLNGIYSRTKIKPIQTALNKLDMTLVDGFVPKKKVFAEYSTYRSEKKYKYISQHITKKLVE